MTNGSDDVTHSSQRLSALADGEIDAGEVASVIGDWQTRAQARRTWHDYHLIGDVLRSEDLASSMSGDAAFLDAVRCRLASEPTVLAPAAAPVVAANGRRPAISTRRFGSLAALAAGLLVVVAGTFTVTNFTLDRSTADQSIATRSDAASPTAPTVAAAGDPGADPLNQGEATVASGQLIRDAGLDRYLAAHHQWSSNSRLGGHAVYLRSRPNDLSGR